MKERIKSSFEQNKLYTNKQCENNKKIVNKVIENWIEESELTEVLSKPFFVNLKKLNELVSKKYFEDENKEIKTKIKDEVEFLESEILRYGFGLIEKNNKEINMSEKYYLWATFRDDGMVITVGKTNMKNGDLLKYEDIYSAGTGNTRIILQQLLTPRDRELFDSINKKLYSYSEMAIIVGIKSEPSPKKTFFVYDGSKSNDVKEIRYNNTLNRFVLNLESCLGDYLLSQGINILNDGSHRK
ncbi:hypothetical protein [Vagococcus fluvialis]|uniref:hypothetical protein n=1 Tax=Vagococcus fluvialis TaxID=2738 RepID=UPI001A8F03C4|nr:hypothetical protein [Vagococcus fluvialis]MBO0444248.1 hypothetical protein [Vagococcus fluvialis]